MAEKRIIGRAVQKHDIEKNWLLATGFTPMAGELIVYDVDETHNYERIKIGDGAHNINELPFYAGSWNDLKDKPITMAPSGHKHDVSGVNGLQIIIDEIYEWIGDEPVSEQINTAIENKADVDHTHDTLYVNLVNKLPSAEHWITAAYGGGKFVTVAPYTDKAAYSTDGINWTGVMLPIAENWTSIAYGGGQFVLVAANTTNMLISNDGITWRTGRMPSSEAWMSVAYDGSYFVVVASGTSRYAYGYGGGSWSFDDFPISAEWSDISYDGSRFIVTARYSDTVLRGFTYNWEICSNNADSYSLIKVASDNNGHSAAIASQYNGEVCWSANGSDWFNTYIDTEVMCDIAYGDGKFVIVGSGNKAFYSLDGSIWTQSTLPSSLAWNTVVYGDGKFVAIASSSVVSAISYDGINWTICESSMLDKNGNDIIPQIGGMLSEWSKIYDSGEISSDVNAFSGIDVSGYKHIMVAIKCVNTTKSAGGVSGAIVFNGYDGRNYSFKNILPNLIKNTTGTSGGMAIFQVVNGFIICENAMRAQSADNMLSDTEGYGADNLTPVGGGIIACTNPVATLMVSNANLSSSYYYGAGSRTIVWGCRI